MYIDQTLPPFTQVVVFTLSLTSLANQTQRVIVMEMMIVATSTGWLEGESHTSTLTMISLTISQVRARDEKIDYPI